MARQSNITDHKYSSKGVNTKERLCNGDWKISGSMIIWYMKIRFSPHCGVKWINWILVLPPHDPLIQPSKPWSLPTLSGRGYARALSWPVAPRGIWVNTYACLSTNAQLEFTVARRWASPSFCSFHRSANHIPLFLLSREDPDQGRSYGIWPLWFWVISSDIWIHDRAIKQK